MKEAAPFERILVTAAAEALPECYIEQLSPGGIMIVPVGANITEQTLLKIRKDKEGNITQEPLMPVRFVPLVATS